MMEQETAKILVVDDDSELRHLIKEYLEKNNFSVDAVETGEAMDSYLLNSKVDLIILDLMLPGEHGLTIAQRIKKATEIPIIIVSAQGEDVDRIVGLEIGADDYLAKPFNPRELLARVRAVLRRSVGSNVAGNSETDKLAFGDFEVDIQAHRLTRGQELIPLTSGEFDLLSILAKNPNRVLDRDRILDLLTGAERSPFDRSIDVRITRLRAKIEVDPANPLYIKTIWGKGYMFCPSEVA